MKSSLNVKQIIDLVKRDALQEFEELIGSPNLPNYVANFHQANHLVERKCGSPLLHVCAQHNASKICKTILIHSEFRNLVNYRDTEGKTPLYVCSIFGSIDCAQILLSKGAEVNALKRGDWTPLMNAVAKCDLDLARTLLQFGADLSPSNKDGWNTLHLGTRTGNMHLVQLLESYAKENGVSTAWQARTKNGRTIMHICAMHRHLHLAIHFLNQLSLDELTQVNREDVCGVTPFMDAARVDSLEMCQLLREHLGDSFQVNQSDLCDRNALHFAAQANSLRCLEYLVSTLRCDINWADKWGQTAIFLAVREGHEQATKLLLSLGAEKTLDVQNRSLQDIAQQYGHVHLVSYLS